MRLRRRITPPPTVKQQPLRIGKTVRTPIVTTSLIKQLFVLAAAVSVVGYIAWQVLLLAGNPQLHLEFPAQDQVVYSSEIEIIGNTTPGNEIYIDGQPVQVGDDGSFRYELVLAEGTYTFEIEARSGLGRTTTLSRTVIVETGDD